MIRQITDETTWNEFLLGQHPNTFLQSWEWGQVQRRLGEDVCYFGFFTGDRQVGACLVITVNARRGRHYLIPHGPILYSAASLQSLLAELTDYLRRQASRDRVVALRVAPLIKNTPDSRRLFRSLGFRPAPLHVHAELTWMREVTAPEEEMLAGMRKTTRHAIRRAQAAGVTEEVKGGTALLHAETLDRFYRLYEQTQTRHHFVPYSRATLAAQLEEFSRHDRAYVVLARHGGRDVAAVICFHFGRTVFYYHGASLKMPSSIPAAQLAQWVAIKEAKRRGATRYNFWGIAPEEVRNPKKRFLTPYHHPFTGITTFKKGFGGYAIDYLHAQDRPLSPWYWKLWLIETLRKKKRGF